MQSAGAGSGEVLTDQPTQFPTGERFQRGQYLGSAFALNAVKNFHIFFHRGGVHEGVRGRNAMGLKGFEGAGHRGMLMDSLARCSPYRHIQIWSFGYMDSSLGR